MASAKNQTIERKVVNNGFKWLECGKNSICENAGITRHVHESKQDTRSPWRQFTANLRCSRKLNHLSLLTCDVIERKGGRRWNKDQARGGNYAVRAPWGLQISDSGWTIFHGAPLVLYDWA
jgi:hypothetical protein